MTKTYVDADLLIAAALGNDAVSSAAISILTDPNRDFASSIAIMLETLAPTIRNGYVDQCDFYEAFLSSVTSWAVCNDDVMAIAFENMIDPGMQTIDSIHVACAISLQCDEFITAENKTSAICTSQRIKTTSIRP